jgi:hypothetical protein
MPLTASPERDPAAFSADTPDTAENFDTAESDEEIRRSAMNIAVWSSYLPADCVETMIMMGWDKTT